MTKAGNYCDLKNFLNGDVLGHKFLESYRSTHNESSLVVCGPEQTKVLSQRNLPRSERTLTPETVVSAQAPLTLDLTPSSYCVYVRIRQALLEQQAIAAASTHRNGEVVDEDGGDTRDKAVGPAEMSEVITLGLHGVFEIARETHVTQPELCARVLHAFLRILEGHSPEDMNNEPRDIVNSLYNLLMEIACTPAPPSEADRYYSLSAVAASCLISLVIAEGNTGKILMTAATLLMSPPHLASQDLKMPGIVCSLQRSVQAVLLQKTDPPQWSLCGVPESAVSFSFQLRLPLDNKPDPHQDHPSALASDGKYLYLILPEGLFKIGSGYGSTIKGFIYGHRSLQKLDPQAWLACVKGRLYYRTSSSKSLSVTVISTETLQEEKTVVIDDDICGGRAGCFFSDGENIGRIVPGSDKNFIVKMYSTSVDPLPLAYDLPLKVARRRLNVFGASTIDACQDICSIVEELDDDVVDLSAGKDFYLIRTGSGKVYWTGKTTVFGDKHDDSRSDELRELALVRSTRIVQASVGHDGAHTLLLGEDGAVFFAGTSKRGEDGDTSLGDGRRSYRASKPKKMTKLDGKLVVWVASNNGTSALVTKDGEVFMFGKDSTHCDHRTGRVSNLNAHVVQVHLGKAHAIALTNGGQVYSFGLNNKGQCGRDMAAAHVPRASSKTRYEEEERPESVELPCRDGSHRWRRKECMVCTVCRECTGYGETCINSGLAARNPGQQCGCGSGDSGCEVCGCCRACAYETGGAGATHSGRRRGVVPPRAPPAAAEATPERSTPPRTAGGRKYEMDVDYFRMTTLPPSIVNIGDSGTRVIQVSCGLHHTVVLTEHGQIYTFGSNQHGQLGLGDLITRGKPASVPVDGGIVQVAAGNAHTVVLTAAGRVFTFGSHQKGQLGRPAPADVESDEGKYWFATPAPIPSIGASSTSRATWIGASADQTYIRLDEYLIDASTLARSHVFAGDSFIGFIPRQQSPDFRCLTIQTKDGTCRSFKDHHQQADVSRHSVCYDTQFDLFWSFDPVSRTMFCYNLIHSALSHWRDERRSLLAIVGPELAVPTIPGPLSSRSHVALFLLACVDTLVMTKKKGLRLSEAHAKREEQRALAAAKEESYVVNRFKSHGGGWGYTDHSVEAIRFSCDANILLTGYGLFGGRGLYFARIRLFHLGMDGGENELYGDLLAETEERPFECPPREKYHFYFDEPIPLLASHWYCAWVRISGPSSDCGSAGQSSVTTDDHVTFKFKSSKKSNNGTDIISGQIPQLLYRLHHHTGFSPSTFPDASSKGDIHLLGDAFSGAISPECFTALQRMLRWSWNTFNTLLLECLELHGTNMTAALLDLDRLMYINTSAVRLLCSYICELYPVSYSSRGESERIAECVADVCCLLRRIITENRHNVYQHCHSGHYTSTSLMTDMSQRISDECYQGFVECFHAFYPTQELKWACLCDLVKVLETNRTDRDGIERLLSAVIQGVCRFSNRLLHVIPIIGDRPTSLLAPPGHQPAAGDRYSTLVRVMVQRAETARLFGSSCTFKEVMDRLLAIVLSPVKQALSKDTVAYSDLLVSNSCALIAALVGELISFASGNQADYHTNLQPICASPNRFTRTSQNAYWNPGNGNPDAICFSVDKPGVCIAGVGVYGGGAHYEFELELLEECTKQKREPGHATCWTSLETSRGTYSIDDCINNVAELRFSRPKAIKEGVKYAIRLKNFGSKSYNGDGGHPRVKCADGTTFTFTVCSLSVNGTNPTRGQIPYILFYRTPCEGEIKLGSWFNHTEQQAMKNAFLIARSTVKAGADLLKKVQQAVDFSTLQIVNNARVYAHLFPLMFSHIGPVAVREPWSAVQTLNLVQEILPLVAKLNCRVQAGYAQSSTRHFDPADKSPRHDVSKHAQPRTHYAVVESEHPYKSATVFNHMVTFPDSVKWMIVEFEPGCSTGQPEDTLQLYIPGQDGGREGSYIPVHGAYSTLRWPEHALLVPGNQVLFSLETASDYVKDGKSSFYGFKCTVVGHEWPSIIDDALFRLEAELVQLGSMCAVSLIRKDIVFPKAVTSEPSDDVEDAEERAQSVITAYPSLLGKGFALPSPFNLIQLIEGNLSLNNQSNEMIFLKEFVANKQGTTGGRLARWLQPDSYLDPSHCEIVHSWEKVPCGLATVFTLQAKDQYGCPVVVPNLQITARAIPCPYKDQRAPTSWSAQYSGSLPHDNQTQKTDIPYAPTTKDGKDIYHSISMMKNYENFSFEELRYMSPSMRRPIEHMSVEADVNGSYSLVWTPLNTGIYRVNVAIDGHKVETPRNIEVTGTPRGEAEVLEGTVLAQRRRKFIGAFSSGLRIRSHPTLQSEQIGLIKPGGVICITEELHNDDGVWVRLDAESMRKCCSSKQFNDAWALQYNKHLERTLLQNLETQALGAESNGKVEPMPGPDNSLLDKRPNKEEFASSVSYEVVRCGASGHNIRSHPVMTATPIGMLIMGSDVAAQRETSTQEGEWIQLSSASRRLYCHDTESEAWTLARGKDGTAYLVPRRDQPPSKHGGPGDYVNVDSWPRQPPTAQEVTTVLGTPGSLVDDDSSSGISSSTEPRHNSLPTRSPSSDRTNSSKRRHRHDFPDLLQSPRSSATSSPQHFPATTEERWPRDLYFDNQTYSVMKVGSLKSEKSEKSVSMKSVSPKQQRAFEVAERPTLMVPNAMSPSFAECQRAVFAAFIWHEGITHDAMACASFIKFHPGLSKNSRCQTQSPQKNQNMNLKKEAGDSKNASPAKLSFEHRSSPKHSSKSEIPASVLSGSRNELPPTLRDLVSLWERIRTLTLKVIEQDFFSRSVAKTPEAAEARPASKKFHSKERHKRSQVNQEQEACNLQVRVDEVEPPGTTVNLGADRNSVCDLCGGLFAHPVTYHMREAHPGCGQNAGGQGYNSAGHFCGGWAGNCGDGGIGGSSWYLICDHCRDKYMMEKQHSGHGSTKDQPGTSSSGRKSKKKVKQQQHQMDQTITIPEEPHAVMTNNAMFLLSVASSASMDITSKSDSRIYEAEFCENIAQKSEVFPKVPLLYLKHLDVEKWDTLRDLKLESGDKMVYQEGGKLHQFLESPGDNSNSDEARNLRRIRHAYHQNHISPQEVPRSDRPRLNMTTRSTECSPESDSDAELKNVFQRSISEVYSRNMPLKMPAQRRWNVSDGYADEGMSLLRKPSPAMARLAKSVLESGMDGQEGYCRPVLEFVFRRNDLTVLRAAMKQAVRKSACRIYGFQALNWLLRSTTQPSSIHDVMWYFVNHSMFNLRGTQDGRCTKQDEKPTKTDPSDTVCEHPVSDISAAGEMIPVLEHAYQTLLQSVSDVTMYLPPGSPAQRMAIRCWHMKFRPADHSFLHKSHVFNNISQILSRADEVEVDSDAQQQNPSEVLILADLSHLMEIRASSRQTMVDGLTDESTETFWESGDEDRGKAKVLTLKVSTQARPHFMYIHVDNTRDTANKVTSLTVSFGATDGDNTSRYRQIEVDARYSGWVHCELTGDQLHKPCRLVRLELRGPDSSLRVRQVKVLGVIDGYVNVRHQLPTLLVQTLQCEAETLKVFKLLTSLVFGRLLANDKSPESRSQQGNTSRDESTESSIESDNYLKEHMVSILFSRSKLSSLQRQVCAHIVHAIREETRRISDEWDLSLGRDAAAAKAERYNDGYCFELLSMVLALSGSVVGRSYLAQQSNLIHNIIVLLHTASPRVQRQVTVLLRRILPEVSPRRLTSILNEAESGRSEDSLFSLAGDEPAPGHQSVPDVFLCCIAKALTIQVKAKNHRGRDITTVRLSDCVGSRHLTRWWFRGETSPKLALSIVKLLKDMISGRISESWMHETRTAICSAVMGLTRLEDNHRTATECIKLPALWLCVASLCVLEEGLVRTLTSTNQSVDDAEANSVRATCDNHDDGETMAMIFCADCGNLCADCDRFLHLSRKTSEHKRQIFKEEEKAIQVDLHEGCGRVKLYWIMVLADSKNLKAIVEFRDSTKHGGSPSQRFAVDSGEVCRFCGGSDSVKITDVGNVCTHPDCQAYSKTACPKSLACAHRCFGIRDEDTCLPCLHNCTNNEGVLLKQDADDMCMICFTDALACAPTIQLECGHLFHYHCSRDVLKNRWFGPRITFGFSKCPICKANMTHGKLSDLIRPLTALYEDVKRKALLRLEYEGHTDADAITNPASRFYNDLTGFALEKYAYYVCDKCGKAYYGGEARCDEQAVGDGDYDPTELVCGACSDVTRAQICPRHGTDFLEYKCRYCCSVAVFFCFGTTHFCNTCHDDFQRVTNMPKNELPHCPAGPKGLQLEGAECPLHVRHPPTGDEFALGCGICRNAHTF